MQFHDAIHRPASVLAGGWELIIDERRATQVRSLAQAAQQVRDFLDTDDSGIDHDDWAVRIHLADDQGLGSRLEAARAASTAAQAAQVDAAAQTRRVVRDLRANGVSVADCAALLGVSRGRVSQLCASPS